MSNPAKLWLRFAAVAAMLLGVAVFLEAHRQPETGQRVKFVAGHE